MKPAFHPHLVNGPCGDSGLYIEFSFERRALLFDIGELAPLSNRKLLRLTDVFVSHTHMDHFVGLDRLLRVCLGRDMRLRLYGPAGFIAQVEHRLASYSWNLVHNYTNDFQLAVTEVWDRRSGAYAEFHVQRAFRREAERPLTLDDGRLLQEGPYSVRCAVLEHRIPSLAFLLEEQQHVNVWKNRLEELGLPVGPWLRGLKEAVLRGAPDQTPLLVSRREDGRVREHRVSLGELRETVLKVVPGRKLGYVADSADTPANREAILELVRGADLLFIEAAFTEEDAALAQSKRHLTARQAGEIARTAEVGQVVPFHFSARYNRDPSALLRELNDAFRPPAAYTPDSFSSEDETSAGGGTGERLGALAAAGAPLGQASKG